MTHPDLQRATGSAAPTLDVVTRVGFAAKGIVTILVGVLALRFALRSGGEITGQEGAVELVLGEPFGRLMLVALAVGLAAYALWMFVAAFVDPERKGESFQGIAERLGFFVTGIGYALIALTAFKLLLGWRGGGGLDLQHVLATVLTPHVGRALVGLAGLIVMTAGVLQLRLGITGRFRKNLQTGRSRLARLMTSISGRVGYLTLGILSLIGRLVPRGGGDQVRPVGGGRMVGGALAALGDRPGPVAARRGGARLDLLRAVLHPAGAVSKVVEIVSPRPSRPSSSAG